MTLTSALLASLAIAVAIGRQGAAADDAPLAPNDIVATYSGMTSYCDKVREGLFTVTRCFERDGRYKVVTSGGDVFWGSPKGHYVRTDRGTRTTDPSQADGLRGRSDYLQDWVLSVCGFEPIDHGSLASSGFVVEGALSPVATFVTLTRTTTVERSRRLVEHLFVRKSDHLIVGCERYLDGIFNGRAEITDIAVNPALGPREFDAPPYGPFEPESIVATLIFSAPLIWTAALGIGWTVARVMNRSAKSIRTASWRIVWVGYGGLVLVVGLCTWMSYLGAHGESGAYVLVFGLGLAGAALGAVALVIGGVQVGYTHSRRRYFPQE